MDYNEFANRIKAKYPEYNDMDNKELAEKMVAKFPDEYSDVTFDTQPQITNEFAKMTPEQLKAYNDKVDAEARGNIAKGFLGAGLEAASLLPIFNNPLGSTLGGGLFGAGDALLNNKPLGEEIAKGMGTGLVSFPLAKGVSKAASKAANTEIGKKVIDAVSNSEIAKAVNEYLQKDIKNPVIDKIGNVSKKVANSKVGKAVKATVGNENLLANPIGKLLNSAKFKTGTANVLEALTSLPSDYIDLALNKELAGNSILKGKFNPKTAYHGVENKIRLAKSLLPTPQQYATQYKNIGNAVRTKLNNAVKPESYYAEQYKNIGNAVRNKLNNTVKPESYYIDNYSNLGKQVVKNRDLVEAELNNNLDTILNDELNGIRLNNDIDTIRNDVIGVISGFGNGGNYNSALSEAPRLVENINDFINTPNLTMRDLHRYKEYLYDLGFQADAAKQGTTAALARGTANKLNSYLRNNIPNYAKANDDISKFIDLEKAIGGINDSTIATKLRDYGNPTQTLNGFNENFANFENVVPQDLRVLDKVKSLNNERLAQETLQKNIPESFLNGANRFDDLPYEQQNVISKFAPQEVQQYKDLSLQQGLENQLQSDINPLLNDISKYNNAPINVQNAIEQFAPDELMQYKALADQQNTQKNILNTINSQSYEKNPRLLANRNDLAAENAIGYLQDNSGVNFMDELNDIRSREALEKLMPGQGGGYGSEQGFWNKVRGGITTAAAGLGGTLGGVPGAIIAPAVTTTLFSPKLTAKGTIKNIGKINKLNELLNSNSIIPLGERNNLAQRLLAPIVDQIIDGVPLQGRVEYYENR